MTTQPDYTELYRAVMPSVVSIYVGGGESGPGGGAGSGFVYDEAGHVVTNEHVVSPPRVRRGKPPRRGRPGGRDGRDERDGWRRRGRRDDRFEGPSEIDVRPLSSVEVRFSEGDWRTAEVVGTDVHTDLAVVRVDSLPDYAVPLPVAEESPEPGQPVAALGNPMGLDGSITSGIISGTNRSMATGGGFALPDTVQTDAPINPGNSGGPLVTATGNREADVGVVVGVNRARQGDNIGFAVSPEIVNRVVPSLIEDGVHRHPYLKISTLDVSPAVAEANGLDEPRGILVVDVRLGPSSGTVTESSQTKTVRGQEIPVGGDVIVGIDGNPIDAHEELMRYLITECEPGEVVELQVIRNGVEETLDVELAVRPTPGGQIPVQ